MMEYTVAYIKNGQDYAYDTFMAGTTIAEIIEELVYEMNRYGVDYDEIAIYDVKDEDNSLYYHIVEIDGMYQLEA